VSVDPRQDPVSTPGTVSGPIATHCPPPLEGGREEAAAAAGRWGLSPEETLTGSGSRASVNSHMLPGRGGEVYITELLI